jgi:anti-sigma factor RsiW
MTCDHAQSLLSAYFDRELDTASSLDVAAHTHACPRCSAALQRHEELRAAMRAGALVFPMPVGLERRVRHAVDRTAGQRFRRELLDWRWTAVPLAAAVAAALAWQVTTHRGGMHGEDLVLAELVSAHVRSLMVDHLVDVATSDQHTVKPWFNGKVDFAPPVNDFSASGFPLLGGRADYIAGRPVAALVYGCRKHLVNVFIWPSAGTDTDAAPQVLNAQGYHLAHWSSRGLAFWAVSDASAADLDALARLFQDAS